eukprot:3973001-Amphidinium_carterae.1
MSEEECHAAGYCNPPAKVKGSLCELSFQCMLRDYKSVEEGVPTRALLDSHAKSRQGTIPLLSHISPRIGRQ